MVPVEGYQLEYMPKTPTTKSFSLRETPNVSQGIHPSCPYALACAETAAKLNEQIKKLKKKESLAKEIESD